MLNWLAKKLMNPYVDDLVVELFTKEYNDNPYIAVTSIQKLGAKAVIEATMRAETGKVLSLPYGSNIRFSPWNKLLFNPRQLFELPTKELNTIKTDITIGKNCKKPLKLSTPIMITGMSYGGSLSLNMKTAIAKGATMADTSTNTGESGIAPEVRENAKYLIGQYNRADLLNTDEQLSKLDAIEIQLGQGAWGGGVESVTYSKDIDEKLRKTWKLKENEDCTFYSRMPNINSTDEIIKLVNDKKNKYDVPIGVKIAGSDFIENELEVITKTNADFIVIDGCEGGTAEAPPTLEDNVGLPTLYSLVRAVKWLDKNNLREKVDIIITGGLTTPGHFLKALALGADAVYIGSIAIFALIQSQATKALPDAPPTQISLQTGKYKDKLNIDKAALNLSNFINSCNEEMKLVLQAMGKNSLDQLSKEDLVTLDKELSEFMNIRYALNSRE